MLSFDLTGFECISSANHKRVVAGLTSGFVFTYGLTLGRVGLELHLSHHVVFVQYTNNSLPINQKEQDKDFLEVTYADSLGDLELDYQNEMIKKSTIASQH